MELKIPFLLFQVLYFWFYDSETVKALIVYGSPYHLHFAIK